MGSGNASFRPGLWPTLAFLPLLALLLGLGRWQLERADEKHALHAGLAAGAAAEPVALPTGALPRHTRVRLTGRWDPTRQVLLRLGTAGVPGNDNTHFTGPSDIVVAPNGDIFVADGHDPATNNRVVKFSRDGKFVKAWGRTGSAAGEFRALHVMVPRVVKAAVPK